MRTPMLKAVTATGASQNSLGVGDYDKSVAVQIDITGSPTAVTVDLEGSLDNSSFSSLASHVMTSAELAAGTALFFVAGKDVDNVRPNLTTLTGGTSPTVTVRVKAD